MLAKKKAASGAAQDIAAQAQAEAAILARVQALEEELAALKAIVASSFGISV